MIAESNKAPEAGSVSRRAGETCDRSGHIGKPVRRYRTPCDGACDRRIAQRPPGKAQGSEGALHLTAAESLGGQGAMLWRDTFRTDWPDLPQPRLNYLGINTKGAGCMALDRLAAETVDDLLRRRRRMWPRSSIGRRARWRSWRLR